MMIKERQKYDRDFKQKAVELSFARGSAKEITEELGIRPELLYRWRREYQKYENNSFPGKGKPKMTDLERENAQLRKELSREVQYFYSIYLKTQINQSKKNELFKTKKSTL